MGDDMEKMRRGDQVISYDKERTIQAYASIRSGSCEECGCSYCRNFAAQRDTVFPTDFRFTLDSLGIDSSKEGEVYECGLENGRRFYGGWFYFSGRLVEAGERLTGTSGGFEYYFRDDKTFPKPSVDFGPGVAAVEFYAWIPWVLAENAE
jgi:hypothetical protein